MNHFLSKKFDGYVIIQIYAFVVKKKKRKKRRKKKKVDIYQRVLFMSKRPNVLINISMQELAMVRICSTEENKSPIIVQFGPFRRGH